MKTNTSLDKKKIIALASEWEEIWKERPFDNSNGLGCQGAFALYYFLKEMDPAPELVVECGTWRGFSTWVIKTALPNAKIICSDPILASRQFLNKEVFTPEYRIKEAKYTWQDFSNIEIIIPEEKRDRAVVFFDDHQNKVPRLEQAIKKGFKHIIYDDNVPYEYTHTSFEYLFNVEKDTSIKKYLDRYEVFPPIYSAKHKSGVNLNGLLQKNEVYLTKFFESKEGYSWLTKVEVKEEAFKKNDERGKNIESSFYKGPSADKKIIHICFNNMHVQPLIDILNSINTEYIVHEVYVERNRSIPNYDVNISKSDYANFFDVKKQLNEILKKCVGDKVEAVVFHGLFFEWQKTLVKNIGDRKKTVWVMWGGDLYNPVMRDSIDKAVIQRLDAVATGSKGDYEFFSKNYPDKPLVSYRHAVPIPFSKVKRPQRKENILIIGNSGDISNCHIEIIESLSKKSDIENFKLVFPFAYNARSEYKDKIIEKLKASDLYKNSSFIDSMLPAEEYFSIIAKARAVIMAHNRQQALGNIFAALYFDNLTVVRDSFLINEAVVESSVWSRLKDLEVKGFISFNDFKEGSNIENMLKTVSNNNGCNMAIVEESFDISGYKDVVERMASEIIELF